MEDWQRKVIETNIDKLISSTVCNVTLLATLQASGILNEEEIEELNGLGSKRAAQSHRLYSILPTRVNAYATLLKCLENTNQSGALRILVGDIEDFKVTIDEKTVLGRGCNGTVVYKGTFGNLDVAVKRIHIIDTDQMDCTQAVHEINVLKSCDKHENIVRYFGSKKTDKQFLILLEICEMTLSSWVIEKAINIPPIEVLRQIAVGLSWLHEHRIVHRDLKPDNILLTRNPTRIKISDFGLSRKIKDNRSSVSTYSICGTTGWVAPEILNEIQENNFRSCKFTFAADIFALGCVYYFVMTDGKHPFGDRFRCQGNILDGKSVLIENDIIHGCRKNTLFIRLMISQNPNCRPSCNAILTSPIFWTNERHLSFMFDLNVLNKEILSTCLNVERCRRCQFHQNKVNELLHKIGYHDNNISLCSNNLIFLQHTSLQISLPQYYVSDNKFHIQGIIEYLGRTTTNPLYSSDTANNNPAENLQENYHKKGVAEAKSNIRPDEYNQVQLHQNIRKNEEVKERAAEDEALGKTPTDSIAIGIDLGTTYCCVAVVYRGKTAIIKSVEGRNTTASYVFFNPDGTQTIGNAAKENALENPENTVYDAKRILGREFRDNQLQEDMKSWPFTVLDGEHGPVIQINGKEYLPEEVVAYLLKDLVKQAEKALGAKIRQAVVTVPAYFTDGQRQATIDAAEIAGLEVRHILNEPTAAALAYKLERIHEDARKVLVFDLGGGTFDISILEIDGKSIRILNIDGDTHLGGEDFDKVLAQYCSDEFKKVHGVDPFEKINSIQKPEKDDAKHRLGRLQNYSERAKTDLTTHLSTVISIDAFYKEKDLKVRVTRKKFEELNAALFKTALEIVERSLKEINLSKAEIDDIVLVGGSTRIPKVQQMLSEYFDGKALNHTVNPDEAVAYGAAVQAALLNEQEAKQLLPGGSIEDVTPMSIGVEVVINGVPGVFSPIIRKNSTIPTIHKEVYRTHKDNQETFMVRIYQGEAPMVKDNKLLGEFALKGIPKAPAGKECIEINMEIDAMGVVHVKAVVKSTRGQESLTVNENKPGRMSRTTKQRLLEEVQSA